MRKKHERGSAAVHAPDASKPSKVAPGDRASGSTKPVAVQGPAYAGPAKSSDVLEQRPGHAKAPFLKGKTRPPRPMKGEMRLPDQEPPSPPWEAPASEQREQYVRLRVRVRDGQLSVIDSHLVDGPLLMAKAFPGTNAYEVTIGDRLLHAGALPDVGIQRSFVNPDRQANQQTHHISERDMFEFMARVPAQELTPETIRDVTVRLLRVKGEARAEVLGTRPLGSRFEHEMRVVGEVRGLPESALPEAIERRGGRTPQA